MGPFANQARRDHVAGRPLVEVTIVPYFRWDPYLAFEPPRVAKVLQMAKGLKSDP